jgi:hypothetical protein
LTQIEKMLREPHAYKTSKKYIMTQKKTALPKKPILTLYEQKLIKEKIVPYKYI